MRIGIVNDSELACEALRRAVASVPSHEVAWIARDGVAAVARAKEDRPDLILMDLFMPGIDGVEATRRIMGETPCSILVVTATVSGHMSKVYQAMGYGALDAVDTPVLGLGGTLSGASPLLRKIEVIGMLMGKSSPASSRSARVASASAEDDASLCPLVVIGTSTGGPFALAEILGELPRPLAAGIILVQHVDATFAPGLGQWLGDESGHPVRIAADGDRPAAGDVYLSGTDDHLILGADRRLHYTPEPVNRCYRPSVDVLFQSVARHWPHAGVAVLLTGMGRDGAEGLLALRQRGWKTIAQDEATSVVWGMPRAAVELDAADEVLPLAQIAAGIEAALASQNRTLAQTRPALS